MEHNNPPRTFEEWWKRYAPDNAVVGEKELYELCYIGGMNAGFDKATSLMHSSIDERIAELREMENVG